ncbi:MAG TPA: CHAD domain-containing protein [Vicinamibacterales bacterium]|nr:CHAD domain-containing protein [Vicinamibacterales bacterium]
MTTSVTLVRVFDRSWGAWLRDVDACRRKPARRAVHALRVDCRRLVALLDVLGHATGASPKALRRLGKIASAPLGTLSPLRDDQVQRRRIRRAGAGPGIDPLLEHVLRREARHQKRARRALAGIDLARADDVAQRVRKGVVRRQGSPTPHDRTLLLLTAVDAAATEVRSRLARLDAGRPRTLHRLRVALKRFRYIVEIAEEVSPNVHVMAQPTLRSLQRRLGLVHDAEVLMERIDRFTGRHRTHRADLRVFKTRIEAARARGTRGLSRALPPLRHALTDLAARASSGAAARAQ